MDLGEMLAETQDLSAVVQAVAREKVIRLAMASTGEGRETVTDMIGSLDAMSQEAVLELTDGQPTTLRAALHQYVERLVDGPAWMISGDVADDLTAILNHPWSDEEQIVALHNPHYGLALHITKGENRDLEIRMGNNRHLVYTVNWEDAGSGGQLAAERVAEAVYQATLARVIPDRDHHIQLSSTDRRGLMHWLERPNGSWSPEPGSRRGSRVTMDAVQGGGILVRTRPYHYVVMTGSLPG